MKASVVSLSFLSPIGATLPCRCGVGWNVDGERLNTGKGMGEALFSTSNYHCVSFGYACFASCVRAPDLSLFWLRERNEYVTRGPRANAMMLTIVVNIMNNQQQKPQEQQHKRRQTGRNTGQRPRHNQPNQHNRYGSLGTLLQIYGAVPASASGRDRAALCGRGSYAFSRVLGVWQSASPLVVQTGCGPAIKCYA